MSYYELPNITEKIMASAIAESKGDLATDKKKQDTLRKKINEAREKGQKTLDDKHQARAKKKGGCDSCAKIKNPCKDLAGGDDSNNGKKHRGGGHGRTKKKRASDGGDDMESHHIPADKSYPENKKIGRDRMPAIRMDKGDHQKTASHGHLGNTGAEYREKQKRFIKRGKFSKAFGMDVADIKDKNGDKYDDAIAESAAYMACLEMQGEL